jgi:hypothetical protein
VYGVVAFFYDACLRSSSPLLYATLLSSLRSGHIRSPHPQPVGLLVGCANTESSISTFSFSKGEVIAPFSCDLGHLTRYLFGLQLEERLHDPDDPSHCFSDFVFSRGGTQADPN